MYRVRLLIILAAVLYSSIELCADDANRRILFSGLSFHEKDLDNGNKLNKYNLGLGYERDYFTEYGEWYYTYHTMVLNDSKKHFQLYVAGSKSIRFEKPLNPWFDVSVGVAGVLSLKKMREDGGEYRYRPIAAVAPVSSFYIDDYTLNFAYIPSYSFTGYDNIGLFFIYFGWQF